MFCKTCGAQQPDTAQFCSGCGSALASAAPRGGRPMPASAGRPSLLPPRLPRFLIPALAAAALLGGVGYGAWHFTRAAQPQAFASTWPLVVTKDGKCGAIDAAGQFVIAPRYDGMTEFNGHPLAAIRRGNLWGFVDQTGREVVEPRFDMVWDFGDQALAPVLTGGVWGFIDRTGQFAVQPQYEDVREFDDERGAWVRQGGQWGRIDAAGQFVIPPKYADVGSFAFGAAPVMIGSKWGLIDPAGKFLIPPRFATLNPPSAEGVIPAGNGSKMGLIDRTGNIVAPATFDGIMSVAAAPFPASRDGKWGFIDQTGQLVVPHMFSWVDPFDDAGLASVQTAEGKAGFIDKTGKYAIAPRFDYANPFVADHAIVRVGNLYGLIDRAGNQVVPAGYMMMYRAASGTRQGRTTFDDSIFVQAPSGLWGVMSLQGKILIAPKFNAIGCMTGEEGGD